MLKILVVLSFCLMPLIAQASQEPKTPASSQQVPQTPLSATAIYKKVSPAVVLIETYDLKGKVSATGSGFVVRSDGAIITNFHVIAHTKQATVRLANQDAYDTVEVLDIDKRKDIAVIKIKAVGLPYLSLGRSNAVEIGDTVLSLSTPLGLLPNSLSQGIVSGIRQADGYQYFQISAPISHGSSGGPIFNAFGEVIGIATATFDEGQNLNFAVPIDYVKGMLSASQPRPLETIYQPEPEPNTSANPEAGNKQTPTQRSGDAKACVSASESQEALRLGRSEGYPDDEIVEAIATDPCKALSYLREHSQDSPTAARSSSKIPSGMIEVVSYDVDGGGITQLVETDTLFYGLSCQRKCRGLTPRVRYAFEIKDGYMYVTTYKDGNLQKPEPIRFQILIVKSR